MLRVRIPPEAALLFLEKRASGVAALLCLVSITDRSCNDVAQSAVWYVSEASVNIKGTGM